MTNGQFANASQPTNFKDTVVVVSRIIGSHRIDSSNEYGEIQFPGWDENIRKLDLEPSVTAQVGFGETVRVRVIGDYESSIAMIMRSRTLFDKCRSWFYLQPTHNPEGLRGLEVWQAPA